MVSGLPDPLPDHADAIAKTAVRFVRYLKQRNRSHPINWQCRIGLAAGHVIGSVVGVQKYIYDVFGPAVSQALSLRDGAAPMTISTDEAVAGLLGDGFTATPNGPAASGAAGAAQTFGLEAVVPGANLRE